ncbi:MAG: glutamate--tRNA ligase [Opitutales bacterium]|nr:glutamate--tRNA ligase [Opitutales bacterium]
MSTVRVRFAPSPTGFFHIGSARTALFNWLYARHTGGQFILRIEDTDAARNTEEALNVLLAGMRWLGMDWDEGPEVGGDYGPYYQSQRGDIYRKYLDKLLESGRAYEKDGAVWFRLLGERYTEYDSYLEQEVEKVRSEAVTIKDLIRGDVVRAESRDFVLCRSDGSPTFHFVNVVDDIEMKITHVIRGEDHLSNTSKHVELFKAFGAPVPYFAHLPLILKDPSQGKGKMSKRDKGSLVEEYQKRHFIPAAVRNAIALLGWNPKDDREVLEIGELIELFDVADVQKGAARFDEQKMSHINFEYLKSLPVETYAWFARPVLTDRPWCSEDLDEDYLQRVLTICQDKINSLEDLPNFSIYFFTEDFPLDPKGLKKFAGKPATIEKLQQALAVLQDVPKADWTQAGLEQAFARLAETHGMDKPFPWWPVIRFAVSGCTGGPDFVPMLVVLGRDRVLLRLRAAIESPEFTDVESAQS